MRFGGDGDNAIHNTQLSVTSSLLNSGVPVDDVLREVLDVTMQKLLKRAGSGTRKKRRSVQCATAGCASIRGSIRGARLNFQTPSTYGATSSPGAAARAAAEE